MARPTKEQSVAIAKRDEEIYKMDKKGYPLDYICGYTGLKKPRVSQILKEQKLKHRRSMRKKNAGKPQELVADERSGLRTS